MFFTRQSDKATESRVNRVKTPFLIFISTLYTITSQISFFKFGYMDLQYPQ
ncbi:hypothetical protein X559_1313 [Paenilisteria newyorkensis]|nr:hypothetical protein X559_1313 [Listeria newyorkensis]